MKIVTDQWSHYFTLELPTKEIARARIPRVGCARAGDPGTEQHEASVRRTQLQGARCAGENGEIAHFLQEMYRENNRQVWETISKMHALFPKHRILESQPSN